MAEGRETIDVKALVRRRIAAHLAVMEDLLGDEEAIAQIGQAMVQAYRSGKKVLLFGNGGSAADAQHIAAELVGRYYRERPPLAAEALTVNSSSLTAISNDYSYDQVFLRQLQALGVAGDIAIGITTSGRSSNVITALEAARQKGMVTVALTGANGERLRVLVDYCIRVPATDPARIQEAHIMIGHILCEIVEESLFGGS